MRCSEIDDNLRRVRERIERAARRAGRNPEEITLVAVSKTFPAEAIRAAFEAGVRHFGENRVQEWERKRGSLSDLPATWHLVGHLQSNKARRAVELFHTIDSVDSLELARQLDRIVAERAGGGGKAERLPVLLEVRLAPEASKSGAEPEEVPGIVAGMLALSHLELQGLMCIPPFAENPEESRPYFRRLRELLEQARAGCVAKAGAEAAAALARLSMGMSGDFEVAIEEGATEVRLGTAIFGERR
jgi:pyridoxal phosphate enzyme (YggS family)